MLSPSGQVLENAIDIYRAILGQDSAGGPQYPDFPSQIAVPCSIQPREVDEIVDEQNRVTQVQYYHVFFSDDPGVRARDMMQYTDARGNTRILFARATRDEGGRGAIFVVRAIERI